MSNTETVPQPNEEQAGTRGLRISIPTWEALRKVAFDARKTIRECADQLIGEALAARRATAAPGVPVQDQGARE